MSDTSTRRRAHHDYARFAQEIIGDATSLTPEIVQRLTMATAERWGIPRTVLNEDTGEMEDNPILSEFYSAATAWVRAQASHLLPKLERPDLPQHTLALLNETYTSEDGKRQRLHQLSPTLARSWVVAELDEQMADIANRRRQIVEIIDACPDPDRPIGDQYVLPEKSGRKSRRREDSAGQSALP
jgi:hypothetical protein